jgi:CII-binding regulator of phage lambda lysogenization HflD
MSFQGLAEQNAAYAQRIMDLERQLGECSGAVQTMERQIEMMRMPDKHKQALRELKALASLYGNPGRTANKLLDVVADLLEIER